MKKNARAVLCGILAGSVTSMVSIIAMSWILKLDPVLSASLMPKSVTSAIGAEVAQELGGIGSLAGALIILTGIVGNLSATALCQICKLHDPIARGVAIGTGSHAVGTARALQMGRVEGAVSSLSIAVAGVLTAAICPILANLLP
jgi:putative effector of murein hydrolase